jgi:pilus assembly protein CpaC
LRYLRRIGTTTSKRGSIGAFQVRHGSARQHVGPSPGYRFLVCLAFMLGCGSAVSFAAEIVAPGHASSIAVIVNKSKNYRVAEPFANVLVGSSDIADVIPIDDRQIYILGKKIGKTNVTIYDRDKRLVRVINVDVKLDTGALSAGVRGYAGSRGVGVGDINGKVVLNGAAADAESLDRAVGMAKEVSPTGVVNLAHVTSSQQVMLKVRFVEASRSAARELGIRWEFLKRNSAAGVIGTRNTTNILTPSPTVIGTGGAPILINPIADVVGGGAGPFATIIGHLIHTNTSNLDVILSALEEQGLVRSLAEPNLVALTGENANFLAGGEYPVPLASTTGTGIPTVTISYKEFGVSLDFTPTVLGNGVISLRLKPEVSELDYANGVNLSGFLVPGLIKRRAQTTIELRDGQSFAIAGLLQSQSQRTVEQLPWLGTIPVLGALFKSSSFQQKETELVVLVTATLVRPLSPDKKPRTPLYDEAILSNGNHAQRAVERYRLEGAASQGGPAAASQASTAASTSSAATTQ